MSLPSTPFALTSGMSPAPAPTDILSADALHALASYTSHYHSMPLPLPPAFDTLVTPAEMAWTTLCADVDASTGEGSTGVPTRKRKREDEAPQHPSSDIMDVDGMPAPTAPRRRKAPWREAVVKVLKQASTGEELNLEAEGVEKIIARLAQCVTWLLSLIAHSLTALPHLRRILPTASREHALSALNTIGLLSCARDGSLTFAPPSTDPTSAPHPACSFCDAGTSIPASDDSTRAGGSRVFTDAPISAVRAVARTVLDPKTEPKIRLAFLKALPRLLRHSRSSAGALSLGGGDELVRLLFIEAEASTRTLRMAAG